MKKKNNNKTNRQRNKQTRKQPKATANIIVLVYITGGDAVRQLF